MAPATNTASATLQLPCDGDGVCMCCKAKPRTEETVTCKICTASWHVDCLVSKPETWDSVRQWDCPDCTGEATAAAAPSAAEGRELVAAIREIEADRTLTEKEKARKKQELVGGKRVLEEDVEEGKTKKKRGGDNEVLNIVDEAFKCSFCMQLPERPVTTPCGHNFCLKCFQKWIGQGKRTCIKCRSKIPPKMASQPCINFALVSAIRVAKMSKSTPEGLVKIDYIVNNQNRPDKAYTTERAQRAGKANACSGRIFVTVHPDHFGPILAENDPERNQGVLVGECWEDRLECRQWGVHRPHVAGIAGQADYGAQSVVLSGGYVDDEDHGEWFLYTGSGGRDLTGNKRTNKEQSFDQEFEKYNEALRVSCLKGYPVRVVSDEHGDRPRTLPVIGELQSATDITERKEDPAWDFDEEDNQWKWKKSPPISKKPIAISTGGTARTDQVRKRPAKVVSQHQNAMIRKKLLKEFSCQICSQVMTLPVTTPCAHNFCRACLEGAFAGKKFERERGGGGRTLRAQKNIMKCPRCPNDISEFLRDVKVNRDLEGVIESLQQKIEENEGADEEDLEGPRAKIQRVVLSLPVIKLVVHSVGSLGDGGLDVFIAQKENMHRRKILVTGGVLGSGYLLYRLYDGHQRRLADLERELARQRENDELIKAQMQAHFENVQRIADTTTLPHAMHYLSTRIEEELDLSHLTERLMKGKGQPNTMFYKNGGIAVCYNNT
ncbi:hypothetical protein Tsubulata_027820 [Turnera subulata]|uniref:RING-type E3 ubiquitin transferase n=1 Tax=Turnera subulata TaxID=218843 RepID=A0A9Q0J8U9_9ROSI|nr:hypothetical protein Tsubulata_027820 [Turnera subulata]